MNLQGTVNVYTYMYISICIILLLHYRIEVEYISNSTNCAWMPITHSVLPNSCNDLSTTYFQPTQLVARYGHPRILVHC